MPFSIIRDDITKVSADAIVNTANPDPVIGGGTDSAIYEAAGSDELLAERVKIGTIAPGDARYTPAFRLDAKYIIHTVGPSWVDGEHGEREVLHSCYSNSLKLSDELSCKSIAFPLIATGVYGFPKDEALSIALEEIQTFLLGHGDVKVILVVFDRNSFVLSKERFGGLESYIDEHYVGTKALEEYASDRGSLVNERMARSVAMMSMPDEADLSVDISPEADMSVATSTANLTLDEMLDTDEMTFQQKLLSLIDEAGIKDSDFYTNAGISRQVFSNLRADVDYQPKKETAVAAVLTLQLDYDDAEDLMARAGYAFSDTNKFDVIVSYCIKNKIYKILDVNQALFKYEQKLLKVPDFKR